MNNCQQIGIQDVSEIPVFDLPSTVDYFFGVENMVDKHSGEMVPQAVLVPGEAIVPNGNNANQFMLDANNPDMQVPDNQVVPAYIQRGAVNNSVVLAGQGKPADFLAIDVEAGLVRCQANGVLNIFKGHDYVIGTQYYLSNNPGQVTTDPSQTGQKLFKPLSRTQLLINM